MKEKHRRPELVVKTDKGLVQPGSIKKRGKKGKDISVRTEVQGVTGILKSFSNGQQDQ